MLKFLRKKTKAIIWTVVVAFIAWGGFAVRLQFEQTTRAPGKIFGKEISFRDYLQASRAVQIFTPSKNDTELASAQEMEARTWEFLILSHEAKQQRIKISDEELKGEIFRWFGEVGTSAFLPSQYQEWVRRAFREEPREFENQLREQMRIQKLLSQIRSQSKDNPEENLRQWLLALTQKARLQIYKPRS